MNTSRKIIAGNWTQRKTIHGHKVTFIAMTNEHLKGNWQRRAHAESREVKQHIGKRQITHWKGKGHFKTTYEVQNQITNNTNPFNTSPEKFQCPSDLPKGHSKKKKLKRGVRLQ
ncbi:hypothetical protein TRVL_02246 [Trypanosoma vivax]|nr:hypothetical protein TRVL_02246 [Trypanosoma vivax]